MSAAQTVAQHLPYLRRYARALAGSQESGDAYVVATLEALIAEPNLLKHSSNPRVAVFRLFTAIWNSLAVNSLVVNSLAVNGSGSCINGFAALDENMPAARRLAHLTPRPRQAFLLVSLEGFSEPESAEILSVDVHKLRSLVEEAGRELAAEIATGVLIIEDEALIALDLESLVESLGHRVEGVARTRAEAVSLAKLNPPGLILADIKLADGSSGVDAVNEVLGGCGTPVIFVTAYPEQYLIGGRPEPAFVIAKPFEPAAVSALISQALFFERNSLPRNNGRPALHARPNVTPAFGSHRLN